MKTRAKPVIVLLASLGALIFAAVPAGAAVSGGASPSQPAAGIIPDVNATRYVCLLNTSSKCLDSPTPGTQLQVDDGAKYNIVQVGTVSSSAAYPFTPGSGLNAHYNGEPVEELSPVNNGTHCVYAEPFLPPFGKVDLGSCSGSNPLWVGDLNQHLVSVVGSDTEVYDSQYQPYVLEAYPAKGDLVYFEREDQIPAGWIYKWAYGE
jgi:hypothetical protein